MAETEQVEEETEEPGEEEEGEEVMEEGRVASTKTYTGEEEEDETRLLEQKPGDEEIEMVGQEDQEELLKEEQERESQEEVSTKEIGEEEMKEEQRGKEITTFLDVKDHKDPLNANQTNIFSSLAINSPKDNIMSDNVATDKNSNCKAEAKASLVAKANSGSDKSPQAEALNSTNAPAVGAYRKEEEKQETDTES